MYRQGCGRRSGLGQGTALKSPRDAAVLARDHGLAAVRDDERGRSRSRDSGVLGDGGRRRTAALLAAGVGGSVTAVTTGVVAGGSRADAQRCATRAAWSAEGVVRARTLGRGARRTEARRCWTCAAGRCARRSAAAKDGVALGRSTLAKEQPRCSASCRREGGEPTRDDRRRCVSERSRAVGSTGPGQTRRAGARSCPYLTWLAALSWVHA